MVDCEVKYQERTPTGQQVFGYDEAGRAHRYDPVRATVIVTVDGEVVHTEQLAKPTVPSWFAFIRDEKCGWIDCWWDDDTVPVERHSAAKARDADIRDEMAKHGVTA